jgi:hypothetical protein
MEDPAARSPHFNGGLARLGARLDWYWTLSPPGRAAFWATFGGWALDAYNQMTVGFVLPAVTGRDRRRGAVRAERRAGAGGHQLRALPRRGHLPAGDAREAAERVKLRQAKTCVPGAAQREP